MNGISSGAKAIIAVDTCTTSWSTKGSSWDYARGIRNVVWTIADLLEERFATEVVELSEYALAAVEGAMNYDVDGAIGGIIKDLEGVHHEASKRAGPDPEALARRLFEWELGSDHYTFFDAVNTYADVLGNKGLAEYQRLAEEEWAGVSALGPDREDRPEEVYPEDSLAIYQERIEPLVNQTNNKAYRHAYELLLRVRELLRRLGREAEFEEYVDLLSLEYRRKRNFIKLLDGME